MATRSRPAALCAVDWLQDELPPGRSGLHDSTATHCVCTLWSSPITQPVSGARTGSGRSNDRVRACDCQCCDDVRNHGAYKYANGRLSNREPAYLYEVGAHLAAVWAPALEPSDARDPRFGDIIANGPQFKIMDLDLRNAQQYGPALLMHRWREIEKDRRKNDRDARETAINALRHRPLEIVGLAVQTYMGYWNPESIWRYARIDLGYGKLNDDEVKILAEKFGFQTVKQLPALPYSLLQDYFLAALSYYFIVVVSPLVCAFATWLSRDRAFAFLLFIHASILMVVITALSPQACIRYLQPVSVLTLLSIAICVDWLARRASPAAMQRAAVLKQRM